VVIRDDNSRQNFLLAGWVWTVITPALILASLVSGKADWGWQTIVSAVVLLAAGAGFALGSFRMASVSARTDDSELVVRNFGRSWRIDRSDIASLELRWLRLGQVRRRPVPCVVLTTGKVVPVQAALSRSPRSNRAGPEEVVRRLNEWLHPPTGNGEGGLAA